MRTIRTAFVGGEVSPELFGRLDLDKEQSGLALCQNFIVLPHGPVANRAGLAFVQGVKNGAAVRARVIPFSFSNVQTFAILMGAGFFRFYTLGSVLLAPVAGPNILANGSFASGFSGWSVTSLYGSPVVAGGACVFTASASPASYGGSITSAALTTQGGVAYQLNLSVSGTNSNLLKIQVGSTPGGHDFLNTTVIAGTTVQNLNYAFVPSGSVAYVTLSPLNSFASTVSVTGIQVFVPAAPAWVSTVNYAVGQLVVSGGVTYYCVATGNTGLTPAAYPVYWYALPSSGEYEIPNPYQAQDLMDIHYVQSGDVLTLVHPSYPPMTLSRYSNTDWVLAPIGFSGVFTAPPGTPNLSVTYPNAGNVQSFAYEVTTLDTNGQQESLPSTPTATQANDLTISGNYNTVTWSAATAPSGGTIGFYNVYKSINGGVFGFIGQVPAGVTTFSDHNITPDATQTPPLFDQVLNSANNYPSAVGYYEQRKVFGGTNNQPESFWATQPGTETNLDYSVPSQASDALRVTIAAQRANYIRHVLSLLDMLLLTASTEWRLFNQNGDALSPTGLTIKAQSQNGASNVQPVIVNNVGVYASSQGGHLRSIVYDWQLNGYRSDDLCLLARHLFDYHTIVDMAFSRSPYPIVWAVSDSGKLLGCTFLQDQQVQAWHQHTTQGVFESICTVTEGNFDVLYAVVRRTLNGSTLRFVERLDTRNYAGNLANAFFVDCGASYRAVAGVFSLSGLVLSCVVSGHGLVSGHSYQFVFSATVLSGSFSLAGNVLTISCTGHGLTNGGLYTLTFSDSNYTGLYRVSVIDANHFSVPVALTSSASGTVSLSRASSYNGAYVVTVVDANDFTISVAAAGDSSGTIQQQVTSVSGLTWLENSTVSVLADGVYVGQQVVSNAGSITLATPASVIQVGLPYTATLETLPVSLAQDGALGQGRLKSVNQVFARCVDFTGCQAGAGGTPQYPYPKLVNVPPLSLASDGVTPALTNGEFRVAAMPGGFAPDGGVVIMQGSPLPLTVVDVSLEVSIGG